MNKQDIYGNDLDVDDTSSYGPETITIRELNNQTYKYFVVDYTNSSIYNGNSTEMSESGATVQVAFGQNITQVFHVPVNKQGVFWEVFEIRNKRVIPINRYYSHIGSESWWRH